MNQRNISLDAIKGFAIILVMLGHVLKLNEINDPYIYAMIEAVQMPVFMMISGYISGFKPPIENVSQWKNVISKRAITYVLPFFTWLFLKQWDDLARGLINTLRQLDRGLWFLMILFILNVLLYTVQLLNRRFQKKSRVFGFFGFCVIFGILAFVFVLQIALHNTYLSPELTLRYIPPFLIGYMLSTYKKELLTFFRKQFRFVGFLFSLILFIYACTQYEYSKIPFVTQILEGLLGCYVIFYIFLNSKENIMKSKLAYIGKYTLEIYTVHFHFATVLKHGKINFELYSFQGIVFVIASFVIMSVISAALIYMIKQVPITNLLMFGRQHKNGNNRN